MVLRAGPLQTGVFNVADVAITLGVALVVFGSRQAAPPAIPPSRTLPSHHRHGAVTTPPCPGHPPIAWNIPVGRS